MSLVKDAFNEHNKINKKLSNLVEIDKKTYEKDFSGNEWGNCKYYIGSFSYMLTADNCPHFRKRLFWKYRPFKKER